MPDHSGKLIQVPTRTQFRVLCKHIETEGCGEDLHFLSMNIGKAQQFLLGLGWEQHYDWWCCPSCVKKGLV